MACLKSGESSPKAQQRGEALGRVVAAEQIQHQAHAGALAGDVVLQVGVEPLVAEVQGGRQADEQGVQIEAVQTEGARPGTPGESWPHGCGPARPGHGRPCRRRGRRLPGPHPHPRRRRRRPGARAPGVPAVGANLASFRALASDTWRPRKASRGSSPSRAQRSTWRRTSTSMRSSSALRCSRLRPVSRNSVIDSDGSGSPCGCIHQSPLPASTGSRRTGILP